ncbi:MAG: cadmium-translocating P-type ATPase [Clostridia bacterium]|nr:cadmium-translocating P-type ATPase [Clostridia bacterium]
MQEHKTDILKISLSAILLIICAAVTHFFELPIFLTVILYLVPYLLVGLSVLKGAAKNILNGDIFGEDFLMSIATIGAFIIGEYAEAVFVMLFFAVGELFEDIATDKSRNSIYELMDVRPDSAYLKLDGNERKRIDSKDLKVGDIAVAYAGEKFAADGIIISGNSFADTSALTGESLPQEIGENSVVFSGTVNLSGVVEYKVTCTYENSTVSKILKAVENAPDNKSKADKFITKFSKVYTPVVVIAAVLLAVVPSLIFGDFSKWIYSALSFLVVSCPCALVISVPLSYFGGIGAASKKGILIKGANHLETLTKVKTFVFDKTGTLTNGNFELEAIHPEKISETELLSFAAAAEKNSNHPISLSILSAAKKCNTDIKAAENVKEIAGKGISAVIENKHVLIGNEKLMNDNGIDYHECHKNGSTVHIAIDGVYEGHIIISDTLKENTVSALKELKTMGIMSAMLTGDSEKIAADVAKKLNIDKYYSKLLPLDKVEKLEEIKKSSSGKVAFVGDGINDAPVLKIADIGIAMGSLGSDAAIEAADVVLMNDNISALKSAVKCAKRTQKIVKENITFALAVKFFVLLLSALTVQNIMWYAAFADVGVMVLAVINATRSLKMK